MHKVKFYPVGNGDTSQIILENGKRILFDYRHVKSAEDNKGPEINLFKTLHDELEGADHDYFDVVAFTHGDKDHIENSSDFFWFEYKKEFQGDDRIKIKELWVPASLIIENFSNDQLSTEIVYWRQEARHRLIQGSGIKVFSRPDKLKDWLETQGLTVEERQDLIVDAGTVVDTFDLESDGVEFFCHSPFIKHVDESDDLRNGAALIFNVRFKAGAELYDYFCVGDSDCDVLEDVITISKAKGRSDRLEWDLFSIPHHCSHHALNPEKGEKKTEPLEKVKELLLSGRDGGYMLCSSQEVEDDKAAYEQKMPPHIQAKNAYEEFLREVDGCRFIVTMEESPTDKPQPIIFNIQSTGIFLEAIITTTGAAALTSKPALRAG